MNTEGLSRAPLQIVEPYWKLILSSKSLLPFLWEMYPNHPNLLASYFQHPTELDNPQVKKDLEQNNYWVAKSKFGREGGGIQIISKSEEPKSELSSIKSEDGVILNLGSPIFQAFLYSMKIQRLYPTFGVWMVNGLPSAIGIRLCNEQIAKTNTSFVSHYLDWDKTFILKCTERQNELRKSLYGSDRDNARQIYGSHYYPQKIDFGIIDKNSDYYKQYHSKTEINNCHCGGGCPSYRKASTSVNERSSGGAGTGATRSITEKTSKHLGGRKYSKTVSRTKIGSTSRSFSLSS